MLPSSDAMCCCVARHLEPSAELNAVQAQSELGRTVCCSRRNQFRLERVYSHTASGSERSECRRPFLVCSAEEAAVSIQASSLGSSTQFIYSRRDIGVMYKGQAEFSPSSYRFEQ